MSGLQPAGNARLVPEKSFKTSGKWKGSTPGTRSAGSGPWCCCAQRYVRDSCSYAFVVGHALACAGSLQLGAPLLPATMLSYVSVRPVSAAVDVRFARAVCMTVDMDVS